MNAPQEYEVSSVGSVSGSRSGSGWGRGWGSGVGRGSGCRPRSPPRSPLPSPVPCPPRPRSSSSSRSPRPPREGPSPAVEKRCEQVRSRELIRLGGGAAARDRDEGRPRRSLPACPRGGLRCGARVVPRERVVTDLRSEELAARSLLRWPRTRSVTAGRPLAARVLPRGARGGGARRVPRGRRRRRPRPPCIDGPRAPGSARRARRSASRSALAAGNSPRASILLPLSAPSSSRLKGRRHALAGRERLVAQGRWHRCAFRAPRRASSRARTRRDGLGRRATRCRNEVLHRHERERGEPEPARPERASGSPVERGLRSRHTAAAPAIVPVAGAIAAAAVASRIAGSAGPGPGRARGRPPAAAARPPSAGARRELAEPTARAHVWIGRWAKGDALAEDVADHETEDVVLGEHGPSPPRTRGAARGRRAGRHRLAHDDVAAHEPLRAEDAWRDGAGEVQVVHERPEPGLADPAMGCVTSPAVVPPGGPRSPEVRALDAPFESETTSTWPPRASVTSWFTFGFRPGSRLEHDPEAPRPAPRRPARDAERRIVRAAQPEQHLVVGVVERGERREVRLEAVVEAAQRLQDRDRWTATGRRCRTCARRIACCAAIATTSRRPQGGARSRA